MSELRDWIHERVAAGEATEGLLGDTTESNDDVPLLRQHPAGRPPGKGEVRYLFQRTAEAAREQAPRALSRDTLSSLKGEA